MTLIENNTTELKREYTPTLIKSVIAFANTSGGSIYVGIEDDGTAVGLADQDGTSLQIMNAIRDSIKPDITLFITCEKKTLQGHPIVQLDIHKGTACPYYLASKGIRPEGVFIRQGSSSVPASETAIRNMIKETDGERYESIRSLEQNLTFAETEKVFTAKNIAFGEEQKKTLGIISRENMYTNLGRLLSDQCHHNIKLAVFDGTEKAVFQNRHEFTGSLLKQAQDCYDYLDRYNNLRSSFEGILRIDKRDYPEEALREALFNAIVHRDYAYSSPTLISIFNDRIEFVSVGGLVKGITLNDMLLGLSMARNERLSNIFYRLSLIEAYGTGIPKILRSYDSCLAKPHLEVSDNAFKITLPNMNMIPDAKSEVLIEKEELQILKFLEANKFITRKKAEELLGVSQATANRILKDMISKDLLRLTGQGKNTRYIKNI